MVKNSVGVFPRNKMTRFIDYKQLINEYSLLISNTEDSIRDDERWSSILDIAPKKDLFFLDSFGVEGSKILIITDDEKTILKFFSGIEKMMPADDKTSRINIKFSMKACKNLSNKELKISVTLLEILFILFCFIFGNFLKRNNSLNVSMVEDPIQMSEIVIWDIFLLYFYENLFNSKSSSKRKPHESNSKNNRDFTEQVVSLRQ